MCFTVFNGYNFRGKIAEVQTVETRLGVIHMSHIMYVYTEKIIL